MAGRILTILVLLLALPASAQDGGQDLSQAASDPTAPLMNFQLQDYYSPSVNLTGGAAQNFVQLRTAIPFRLGGTQNIFRATLPVFTDTPSGATGISDTVLFDLVTFDEAWGRWGVGVVGLVPTGETGLSAEKWAAGPAIGFTMPKGRLLVGVFNQNLFSFAGDDDARDVNVTILQPIVNWSLGGGWSVGASEMNVTWDWEESGWSSLPLGAKLNKLVRIGGHPVQVSVSYEHNFADDFAVPRDLYGVGVKLLLSAG
jgi:hypothetical protein